MEKLGDYNVIKEIGSGPFAKVYLAEHQFIKKQFVLKVIPDELVSDEGFIERFEKNIGELAQLDHPSIVKIHNISHADGAYFIVMDPVVDSVGETMNLDRFLDLKGKVLSESELENILMQVASAFDYAHMIPFEKAHLMHGGLKLSNILIGKNEKGLRVYLSDFGFTHLIGEGKVLLNSYKNLTEALALNEDNLGSERKHQLYRSYLRNFAFLAPEQKRFASALSLDAKTDTFAFGTLAYYLITKEFPEGCFNSAQDSAPEFKLNWDMLISRCLQKDPLKRPTYLIRAMEEFLRKESSEDAPFSWKEASEKVESKMQMSFSFPSEKPIEEKEEPKYFAFEPPSEDDSLKPLLKAPQIDRPTYEPDPGAIFQRELSVSRYQPTQVEVKEVEPILTEMVIIPGGTYSRGSRDGARDEMPRHSITFGSFALDVHPITNDQFVRFLTAMGGEKDSNNNDIIRLRDSRVKRSNGKLIVESGYSKHPVVGVTWYGAMAYAKWVGKRLPTEAEWEVAASGTSEEANYPTGETIERHHANFFSADTTPVMSYPTNENGLYDMAGNVYEWCEDWYAYNYYDVSVQEPDNPKGPPQGVYRVLRGGCWKSLKEDLRCSHRHRNNPGAVNGTYGFRCAADVS